MIKGYANEYEFCQVFHDKFVGDLEEKYINFLEDIYEKELDRKSYVICWKQRVNNKTDVIIRVGKEKKYISIKSGKNNSVHLETLDTFVLFLKEINCPDNIVEIYKEYHKGLDVNGNRIGGKEYQEKYPTELEELNSFLNKPESIKPAIDRFLFQGRDVDNDIVDAIVYGTANNFMYATRKTIYDYLLSQDEKFSTPHFSLLVLQPWARNLNFNPKHEYRRKFVQVKWYRMDEHYKKIH